MCFYCEVDIEYKDNVRALSSFEKCTKIAKFNISYKDPITGNKHSILVCKSHLNSYIKKSERLKKRFNYDMHLLIKEIN